MTTTMMKVLRSMVFLWVVSTTLTTTTHGQQQQQQQGEDDGGGGTAEVDTACDPTIEEACLADGRACVASSLQEDGDGGAYQCGPCREGFVEIGPNDDCWNITNVTLQDFVDLYRPLYKDDIDDGERLERLREALLYISLHNYLAGQQTNVSYTLGVTPYSADTEDDYKGRSGYFYVNVTGTEDELPKFVPKGERARHLQLDATDVAVPDRVDWVDEGGTKTNAIRDGYRMTSNGSLSNAMCMFLCPLQA
jgi:hypothetical protein